MPTDYTYTGQRSEMDGFGLMYYNARWYDPMLGRFTNPDTIVPVETQGTQAWDRYAYVNNNPLRYSDPSRHCIPCLVMIAIGAIVLTSDQPQTPGPNTYEGIQSNIEWDHYTLRPSHFESAIAGVIQYYDLDDSTITSIQYDNWIPSDIGGETDEDGNIYMGYGAFRYLGDSSPGLLGALVGHEIVHTRQVAEGRFPVDGEDGYTQLAALCEYEAYTWVLDNAERFGLSDYELELFLSKQKKFFDILTPDNQERAEQGEYTLPDD